MSIVHGVKILLVALCFVLYFGCTNTSPTHNTQPLKYTPSSAIRPASLHKEQPSYKDAAGIKARYEHLWKALPNKLSTSFVFHFVQNPNVTFHVTKQGIVQTNLSKKEKRTKYYSYRLDDSKDLLDTSFVATHSLSMGVDRSAYAQFCFIGKKQNAPENLSLFSLATEGSMYAKRGDFDHALTFHPTPQDERIQLSYTKSGDAILLKDKPFVKFDTPIPSKDRQMVFLIVLGATSVCSSAININY